MRERRAVLGENLHITSDLLAHIRPPIDVKIFYWMQRGFSTIFSWQNITGENEIHVFMVIVHVLTKSMARSTSFSTDITNVQMFRHFYWFYCVWIYDLLVVC